MTLDRVHPRLVAVVQAVQTGMAALGHPMVVTAAVRSDSAQQALYAKGRTAPGPIVTRADGVTKKSKHQLQADGYGHAVDLAFLDAQGRPSWDEAHPWGVFGALAKYHGATWGGDWTSFRDLPHLEVS